MIVKAKFHVTQVCNYGSSVGVKFGAVTDGSEENKLFWKYTPSGMIEMQITNMEALKWFPYGREIVLDFHIPDSE